MADHKMNPGPMGGSVTPKSGGDSDIKKSSDKPWMSATLYSYDSPVCISGGENEPSKGSDRAWPGATPKSHSGVQPISGGATEPRVSGTNIKKYKGSSAEGQ